MPPMVLSKSFHFPARPLCLLIGSLQRFKRKEKIISGIWNQLKWLLVENASILGSLNSVIKWSLSCCKERFALKLFLRQREIRLFRPERKNLLNPYIKHTSALWQSGDMGEKCNKKVVNFGNWFLCQFSPKTYKFLHGASLTPQKSGDEKKIKKIWTSKGRKKQKMWRGCFSQTRLVSI